MDKIIGHHEGWGLVGTKYLVKPYTLTDGATEVLKARVREKIDIFGVGTDVIDMSGFFVVRRSHPEPAKPKVKLRWGTAKIKVEFRCLELYGESPLFGTVRVRLNEKYRSIGEVGPPDKGSRAAKCRIVVFPAIELPEIGLMVTTGKESVTLASKVVMIPPIGDVARSETSCPLLDEHDQVIGELVSADIEVGNVFHSHPLGATSLRSKDIL